MYLRSHKSLNNWMLRIDKQLWAGPIVTNIRLTVIWTIRTNKLKPQKKKKKDQKELLKEYTTKKINLQACTVHELKSTQQGPNRLVQPEISSIPENNYPITSHQPNFHCAIKKILKYISNKKKITQTNIQKP